jgi:predicted AlkP superfamily phosphohydrolase/phosphomutase
MKTVLIGLDGGTFDIFDPLMELGVMPFLRKFVTGGVRAQLRSTALPITCQAWPTLMTGRGPGSHGIFDFVRFERRRAGTFFTVTNARDLACETIWSMASRQSRRVTVLNFFAMWPPQPIDGYTMSGFVPWRHMKDAVHPPEAYPYLKELLMLNHKELAMDLDLERRSIQGLPPEEYLDWIDAHMRREQQWFRIVQHLMRTDPTDMTAIVFDAVDKLQHLCWRFIDTKFFPADPSPWERSVRERCLDYFHQLDDMIRQICGLAGSEARVFMASDHGFGPSVEVFYVNTWLHDNGYLRWSRAVAPDDRESLTSEKPTDNVVNIDWHATTAYALTASSNGIWIRVASSEDPTGVPPERYQTFRQELIRRLLDYRDPHDGRQVVTRVLTREQAYPGVLCDTAPDLLLFLRDGGFVSVLNSAIPVTPRAQPVGTHRPNGIILASGRGIPRGAALEPQDIIDMAPTILYSLGLPAAADMEGHVAEALFEPVQLRAEPPRVGGPSQGGYHRHAVAARPNDEAALTSEITDRLKALGYIE